MLNVVMLNVVMLNVVMMDVTNTQFKLNVIVLNVIMLSVVAPSYECKMFMKLTPVTFYARKLRMFVIGKSVCSW